MMLFFEFWTSINSYHRILSEATQEIFTVILSDLEFLLTEFSNSDELQDAAKKRGARKELITSIVTSLVLVATAALGVVAIWAEPIAMALTQAARVSAAASRMARASRITGKEGKEAAEVPIGATNSLAGEASGAYIGMSGFYKEYFKSEFKHDE